MRQIPPWQSYDRIAGTGEYGLVLEEAEGVARLKEYDREALFFRSVLAGRKRVLDLGCGPGIPLLSLANRVGWIYGLDASPAMLELAQQNIAALGIKNATLVRGLAEALPFAEGSVDGVADNICIHPLSLSDRA